MSAKIVICLAIVALASSASAGVLPLAAPLTAGVVAPYATSYNAHTVNHAIAAPYVAAAPVVAPAAKLVAAAPAVAPLAYTAAAPFTYAAGYPGFGYAANYVI
ncbi:cuticle protein 16.5-like [Uranotaenia lowii]|uniref:cuticle protein 16.5-like n=1 Tax=Uranotaenia lowii TaxID=190385 RepID=UPI002479BD9A|nr:cuticle protein 16.5-like [Uranotaenia lowii]